MQHESKKLTVIISTFNEGIFSLGKVVTIEHPQVCYLVIHQNLIKISIPEFLNRPDITVISSASRGLSKSRNLGIKHCKTPYALVADDDVTYFNYTFDTVISVFEDDPTLDLALFKIQTPEGDPEYKKYPPQPYNLQENLHIFSSIETSFRVSSVRKRNLKFDRRFGLGSYVPRGEEYFFIKDSISKGLRCFYFPEYIVRHPYESSGKKKAPGLKRYFFKGAVEERSKIFSFRNIKWKRCRESIMNNLVYVSGALFIKCSSFLK